MGAALSRWPEVLAAGVPEGRLKLAQAFMPGKAAKALRIGGGRWDPRRNTLGFAAAMPEWRRHGLLAFTLNLQGGNPRGCSKEQPWYNSTFGVDGSLRPDYLSRLARILGRADELGMMVILGFFYFGQDERLRDEAAVFEAAASPERRWRAPPISCHP